MKKKKSLEYSDSDDEETIIKKVQTKDANIVLLQKVSGYWDINDVSNFIEMKQEKIKESNPSPSKLTVSNEILNQIWGAALVIAYL